jgi:collagenase-like PrtC family protease
MQVSLGPILYYWPREGIEGFYEQLLELPLDVIYLGETVCSKRRALSGVEWIELGRQLHRHGKQVVLSTLALVESASELGTVRRLCSNGELLVEANDMAAVRLMTEQKLPFVAGSGVNIYNDHTLSLLYALGLRRWVAPLELSRQGLADILDAAHQAGLDELETEVFSFGRLPLAYSARCFTARAANLPKDDCLFSCLDHPDGLALETQEGEPFLTINGVQIQSGQIVNLLPQWQDMEAMGVTMMRISPIARHTRNVVERFCKAIAGDEGTDISMERMLNAATCNGYWQGRAGMANVAGD